MKNKFLFTLAFVSLLFMSFSLVNAATYHGKFTVDTGKGSIDTGGCQEDWSNSFWSECSGGEQTFVCIQTNPSCDSENLKPAACDTTRSCGEEQVNNNNNNGGGGGGGSNNDNDDNGGVVVTSNSGLQSTACIEKWSCGAWSNNENSCGTRDCADVNDCGTTDLKPETSRSCSSSSSSDGITFFFSAVGDFVKSKTGGIILFVIIAVGLVMIAKAATKKPVPASA